ncbi:MAG: Co2+/Mg2+ efflux protein ApaG [Myxococcota bacterium]
MSDETRSDATTEGIRVEVSSFYLEDRSHPAASRFVFGYRVRITNVSHDEPVQLKTRHWIIENQLGKREDVRGAGVVGEQPTLAPGQSFEYTSGAMLETPRGTMRGNYQMYRPDGRVIEAAIAPFALSVPYSLN